MATIESLLHILEESVIYQTEHWVLNHHFTGCRPMPRSRFCTISWTA